MKTRLIRWSEEGYRFKDDLEERDLKACKKTVDDVLQRVHPTQGLLLISKDGRSLVTVCRNPNQTTEGPERGLSFVYRVENGTALRGTPASAGIQGGRKYIMN